MLTYFLSIVFATTATSFTPGNFSALCSSTVKKLDWNKCVREIIWFAVFYCNFAFLCI